ncbi:MAG TPA: chloramphenicol acetyltransferase [Anaerolineales bacterium]|nr:chloramphenicol acetyltransferase [Anaerolineales bacterium]
MKIINTPNWKRQQHFAFFSNFDYPHFSLCANVDVTHTYTQTKAQGYSLTIVFSYLLALAANEQPAFRQRIHGQEVVEYEVVHPAPTILGKDELFSFCTLPFTPNFPQFASQAAPIIAQVKAVPTLDDEHRDDLLFLTCIPWVAFTSMTHPIHMHPTDSVPRISWGKVYAEGTQWKMPLSVQVHHALMDGVHVGRYFARVEALLAEGVTLG